MLLLKSYKPHLLINQKDQNKNNEMQNVYFQVFSTYSYDTQS